ncbi:unnamed protein product (macronuclear) [Paramecium tetraurelia]|uniref:FAD/NAD(P)-binding domain-containing protein n=1 Tax=Paramecium tetraurelia TaxID=5888 RepID=A0BM38_PARTE|nr:uncharacterized protein GSPATT00030239001 [Paramecium tetraurelia]CAK59605.1 unnamed protein product [Paramecium tetraurelia]|eukprot:XP_001427003.1 hypothetical protein (macronuclear) [Paramecium tetraurelia strain d4-2]
MRNLNHVSLYAFTARAIHSQVAIIGGGTAGLNVSAQLVRDGHYIPQQIRVFEPYKMHAYQTGWTLVGGGMCKADQTMKPMEKVLPKNVCLSDCPVVKIDPEQNTIVTMDGQKYTYDQLIVASGVQRDYASIKGALEQLNNPEAPVGSIYYYRYAQKIDKMIREFEGGKLIFSEPPTKCEGIPSNIVFLTHERLSSRNVKCDFHVYKANDSIFGIPKYSEILGELAHEKGLHCHLKKRLIEVQDHKAIFEDVETKQLSTSDYDFLHIVPPQKPAAFIAESGLGDSDGFVNVHPNTLQHVRYANVWALGDCSSLPTSKTAAAVMAQTPILIKNLVRTWKMKLPPLPEYEGYTSCPVYTSNKKVLLAEFKYNKQLDETFPVFQSSDSRAMYLMKKHFFPFAYWQLMVRGLWGGRDGIRLFKGV